jgi:hypothetical protein
MAASYHNLLSKCDRALVAYIVAQGAGSLDDVFPAKRSQDRALPCTVCYSEKAEEVAPYSGTYLVHSSLIIRTEAPADAGEDEAQKPLDSDARVAQTFDLFHLDIDSAGDKLADDITKAARALAAKDPAHYGDLNDFTLLDVIIKGPEAGFEQGSVAWTDTLNLDLVACPANVDDPA